jgi:hypothetical protein
VKKRISDLGAGLVLIAFAGCTSGNSAVEPPVKSVSPLSGKLTFAVGTANYTLPDSGAQASGLNTVVAYRQADGLSAALVSTPTITGPTGFLVPKAAKSAFGDAGTNHISGDPQLPAGAAQASTFGQQGGAFSYGFLPLNSTNQALSGNLGYTPYANPFYVETVPGVAMTPADDQTVFLGGPPAFTNVRTGAYTPSFTGYTLGFDSFAGTTLAAGSYTLSLVVPTSATTNGTLTAAAPLASTPLLPVYPYPNITEDGTGGGVVTLAVPAGVSETVIQVTDFGDIPSDGSAATSTCHPSSTSGVPTYALPYNYTVVDHTIGPATANVTLPDGVGPVALSGATSPTLCPGDDYLVTAVGADYGLAEAAPGQSNSNGSSESPTFFSIPGSAAQTDITVSGASFFQYGVASVGTSHLRQKQELFSRISHTPTK